MHPRAYIKALALLLTTCMATLTVVACQGTPSLNYEPIPPNQGRTIAHARGETVVPKQPERMVVLGSVLDALALGVEPVGAALSGIPQRANRGALAPLFGERTEAITVVGHTNQPSLEGIVKLQPDLILGTKDMGNTYSRLAQIAPTVAIDVSRGAEGWKDYVLEAATAMGKADQAKTLIQQYEQRIVQFQTAMGDRLDDTVVSVVRFRPDHVRIYQQNSFSGAILTETGLPRPLSQQRQRPYEAISLEKLSAMDGDVLFFMQDNPEQSILTEVENHPLWSQLDVVQRNQIHEISLEVWFLNSGIVSANMMLNDLFRTLVPDGEQYLVDRVGELVLP